MEYTSEKLKEMSTQKEEIKMTPLDKILLIGSCTALGSLLLFEGIKFDMKRYPEMYGQKTKEIVQKADYILSKKSDKGLIDPLLEYCIDYFKNK